MPHSGSSRAQIQPLPSDDHPKTKQQQQHSRTNSSNEGSTITINNDSDDNNKTGTAAASTGSSPSPTGGGLGSVAAAAPPSPPLATIDRPALTVVTGGGASPSTPSLSSRMMMQQPQQQQQQQQSLPPETISEIPSSSAALDTNIGLRHQQPPPGGDAANRGSSSRRSGSSRRGSHYRSRSNPDIPPSMLAGHGGGGYGTTATIIPPYSPTVLSSSYSPSNPYGTGGYAAAGGGYTSLYPPQQQLPQQYQPRHPATTPTGGGGGGGPPRPRGYSVGGGYQDGGGGGGAAAPPEHAPSLRGTRTGRRGSGRRGHHHTHHRKSKSSSAAVMSGDANRAFWNAPIPPPPPPPGGGGGGDLDAAASKADGSPRGNKFSPRDELRKLTQGLSPSQSQSYRKNLAVNAHSWSGPPPPAPPFLQQHSSSYSGGSEAAFYQQSHHSPSLAGVTFSSPGRLSLSTPTRKSESSRKMHLRQQSAQLYMEDARGVEQEPKCRNVLFLLLFAFHLVFIGYLGQLFGYEALQVQRDDWSSIEKVTIYYHDFVYMACLAGAFAVLVSALLLGAMTLFARNFVQIALVVVITISFFWGTVGVGLSPKTIVPVTGIIALGLVVAYTFIVWDRIPFAAANLLTALSGIRAHPGAILVAFGFQALTLAYAITFAIVVVGVYDEIQEHRKMEIPPRVAYIIYGLLAISFYWTYQVMQGAVQAITAGVISGWWHRPGEEGLVRKVCFKTLFYSMGSICFGALFVGPVRFLRQISAPFRPSAAESSSLECLQECIFCVQSCVTSCVDTVAAGCNAWAFTYIGMYHYGFLDAGYNATELFDRRGWTTIVSDDLIPNVLFLTSLVIGGATGCFAHLISRVETLVLSPEGHGVVPFCEGFVLGLALTSILFSAISAAVNTVLVCFASSPVDFEHNHEQLSHEMRAAWREVWPGALDSCDARISMVLHNSPMAFHSSIRFGEGTPLL